MSPSTGGAPGAVAAGSPSTVAAGVAALRQGGNAVDALVASALMSFVAEPLLTGFCGGGVAILRMDGEIFVCDMFANVPGLDHPGEGLPAMQSVVVDFGPARQVFHVGRPAFAVPCMPVGLHDLYRRWGSLPLATLAEPAIRASLEGVPVVDSFQRVSRLLWPILSLSSESRRMLAGPDGGPLKLGDTFRCPELGETIAGYVDEGPALFQTGDVARRLLDELGDASIVGPTDLASARAVIRPALPYRYRDATVWVPGPPSAGGPLTLLTLKALQDAGRLPEGRGREQVSAYFTAQAQVDALRGDAFNQALFEPGFDAHFTERLSGGGTSAGHTTHISAVDAAGNAAALTSSLGETCGHVVPGTGLLLNNFLGEEDVNPPGFAWSPGVRLMTMCTPTILERRDDVMAMGSGGSSRIRTAVVHGVSYLVDAHATPADAVAGPRAHLEGGLYHVETDGRSARELAAIEQCWPDVRTFSGANMFFGGLHMAGRIGGEFAGGGDYRRSGAFEIA